MDKRLWILGGLLGALWLSQPTPDAAAEDVADLLQRQTQELVDAVATGGTAVWERYLDDKALYTAEDGTVYTKQQMVGEIRPLPPGVAGTIRVTGFKAVVHGDVAVASYVNDEHEDFHGHQLHCQYRATDTWRKTPAGWRLIAGQVLALRTDPPAVQLAPRQLQEYVGRYALTPEIAYEIRSTPEGLEGQQTGRPPEALRAEVADVLFVPGQQRYRKIFQRDAEGRITGFVERREAWDLPWRRLPAGP